MRRQVSIALSMLAVCCVWLSTTCHAAPSTGVLFEVSRSGGPTSYLFGTMHLDDPKVLGHLDRVEPLLSQVDRLVIEAVPDGLAMMKAAAAGFYVDGRSLKDDLEPPFYAQVVEIMAQRGVPEAVLRRMKPWTVAVNLSLPAGDKTAFLDLRLYNRAEELGLPIEGLETIEEQLDLFEQLSVPHQVALLRHTAEQSDELPQLMEEMVDAYRRGDLDYLEQVSVDQQAGYDPELVAWFTEAMIERRNAKMLGRIEQLLTRGRILIAVGALHLAGPSGLLQGLAASGYQLRSLH